MHNIQLGLAWAAAIIVFALLTSALGLDQKSVSLFIVGLGMISALHIGRSEARSRSCGE